MTNILTYKERLFTSIGFAVLALWQMLLPGYILTLDLVFTPYYYLTFDQTGYRNNLPLQYVLKLLYLCMPGWLVEKALLVLLFVLLAYVALTYLPVPNRKAVRLFAAGLYAANPFVYERMLAGQWTHLFAYALLPLVAHHAVALSRAPSVKRGIYLAVVLIGVGVFSLQLFVIAMLGVALWLCVCMLQAWQNKPQLRALLYASFTALAGVAVSTSYWTLASLHRAAPLEGAFGPAHWQAFAASGHGSIPALLNLLLLGGFWGEGAAWGGYFAWPQTNPLFVVAWLVVLLLVGIAAYRGLHAPQTRTYAYVLLAAGVLAWIFAAGAAATPFAGINIFLYTQVPLWSGFRDSQKWVALLALCYSIGAAYGFAYVLEQCATRSAYAARILSAAAFCMVLCTGMYMWGGFAKQLSPAWYPASWQEAKAVIAADPSAKVLVVPWQGYFSLNFAHNLLVANPATAYFGPQAVASQNVRLGDVYDQSSEAPYQTLDYAIRHDSPASGEPMAEFLRAQGIGYVLFMQDLSGHDVLSYSFLHAPRFTMIHVAPELVTYQIAP